MFPSPYGSDFNYTEIAIPLGEDPKERSFHPPMGLILTVVFVTYLISAISFPSPYGSDFN